MKTDQPAKTSVSPRSSPLGTFPPRETSPAAKSEEKRMFSQARKQTRLLGGQNWEIQCYKRKGWIYGEPATHFCLATMDRSRQGCNNRHYSYFEAKRTFLLTSKSSFTSSYCRDEFYQQPKKFVIPCTTLPNA